MWGAHGSHGGMRLGNGYHSRCLRNCLRATDHSPTTPSAESHIVQRRAIVRWRNMISWLKRRNTNAKSGIQMIAIAERTHEKYQLKRYFYRKANFILITTRLMSAQWPTCKFARKPIMRRRHRRRRHCQKSTHSLCPILSPAGVSLHGTT